MPEHFREGMADQGQFILVGRRYIFHQGRKSVAARMGGVAPAFGVTLSLYGVLDAALFQDAVEDRAVCFEGHSGDVWAAKDRAADLVLCQPVNDGLDFWGDCDHAVASRLCFGSPCEGPFRPIVVGHVQIKELRGAEAKVALAQDIVRVGDGILVCLKRLYRMQRKALPLLSGLPAHPEKLRHVEPGQVPGNGVFIQQAAQRLHILLGALSLGAVVHAVLQVIYGNGGDVLRPHGLEIIHCRAVTPHGRGPGLVGGLPDIVHLLEAAVLHRGLFG